MTDQQSRSEPKPALLDFELEERDDYDGTLHKISDEWRLIASGAEVVLQHCCCGPNGWHRVIGEIDEDILEAHGFDANGVRIDD